MQTLITLLTIQFTITYNNRETPHTVLPHHTLTTIAIIPLYVIISSHHSAKAFYNSVHSHFYFSYFFSLPHSLCVDSTSHFRALTLLFFLFFHFQHFFFADSPISLPYIPPSSPFFFYFSFRLSLPSRLAISLFSPCPFGCVFRSWDCHSVKSKGSSAALSPYPFMSTPFLSLDTLSTCPLFQSWQKEQLWYPAEFTITQKENKSLIHKRSYSGKHDSLRQRET